MVSLPNKSSDWCCAKKMSLANVLSAFSAEIFIPSKYLSYGTYMFIYQVNMNGMAASFVETVNTYVRIVPTGIAIFPFSGGIKEITIGSGQSIDLDPGKYSYDFDGIFTGTQLTYRFFCRIVANGLPQDFPSDSYNNFLDLKQLQDGNYNKSSLQISFLNSCFNTTGKLNLIIIK